MGVSGSLANTSNMWSEDCSGRVLKEPVVTADDLQLSKLATNDLDRMTALSHSSCPEVDHSIAQAP